MSKRKLNPREGKLGRFVSPKYAETLTVEETEDSKYMNPDVEVYF